MRFKYEGIDALKVATEDRNHFVRFAVREVTTGDEVLEIYTNRNLDGLFLYDKATGDYRQTLGTQSFSMPTTSGAIRRKLRKMAMENLGLVDGDCTDCAKSYKFSR